LEEDVYNYLLFVF